MHQMAIIKNPFQCYLKYIKIGIFGMKNIPSRKETRWFCNKDMFPLKLFALYKCEISLCDILNTWMINKSGPLSLIVDDSVRKM
jgi:hypothetical protein